MTGWKRLLMVLFLMPALALAPACTRVVNPATGETELTAMSPAQERQVGTQQHPQVLAEFGGAYADAALQAYVADIGERLAAVSELPDLEFTFTLLNSEVVNAFALPGGYVYVTRGLLALADNEAELAGVMAHEIGHVTARHSAQRYSRGVVAQSGVAIGSILAAILGGGAAADLVQQAGGVGAQAYLAGYSRDQEFQADELGVRYLARAGYDPAAMSSFLEKLGQNDALARRLAGREDAPDPASSWFATHPRTPDRVLRAVERASAASAGPGRIDRERYLAEIDGMIYGEDPSQGLVRNGTFVHPELRFAFDVPPGFRLINTPTAVIGQSRDGLMRFDGARVPPNRSMTDYVARDWARELGSGGLRNVAAFQVGGMPAANATATGRLDDGRPVTVALAAIRADGDRVYRFMFVGPGGLSPAQARAYEATIDSFRRLGAQEAAAIQPRRIEIVTVAPGQGTPDLARRMAVDAQPHAQFEVLNGLEPGQPLAPGEQVKLIVQ
ncbi:MAG: M48 family metalloprotease [Geminicoccaceae bacterium]